MTPFIFARYEYMNDMAIHQIQNYISKHLERDYETFSEKDSWRRWGGIKALHVVESNSQREPGEVIHELYFKMRRYERTTENKKVKEMYGVIADEIEEIGLLFV